MKRFTPFLIGLFLIVGVCVYMFQFALYLEAKTCIESGGAWSNDLNKCVENIQEDENEEANIPTK